MDDAFDYMDRYFNGELSPEEKEAFEQRCASDPAFAEELALYVTIHDHLKQQWHKSRLQQIAALENGGSRLNGAAADFMDTGGKLIALQEEEKTQASVLKEKGRFRRLAVAAVTVGVVVVTVTWYVINERSKVPVAAVDHVQDSTSKIIEPAPSLSADITKKEGDQTTPQGRDTPDAGSPARPYVISSATRNALFDAHFSFDAAADNSIRELRKAFAYYNSRDYSKALQAFTEIEGLETMGAETNEALRLFYIHYYRGLSYAAVDSAAKAAVQLQAAIRESPDPGRKRKAMWYLALAYLKSGETKKTEALLHELAADRKAGEYKRKATGLLRKISDR